MIEYLQQLIDQIATRSKTLAHQIQTEEATKQALIIPFISALGYEIYDPSEVTPEFTADVGTKKGEKVDYAIQRDGQPIILFECKSLPTELNQDHITQLYRYFSVTNARIGILTNGRDYKIYSDLVKENVMDSTPFLEFNIHDLSPLDLASISKLHKSKFSVDEIISSASTLKFKQDMQDAFIGEINDPSDTFTRNIVSQFYTGRITSSILSKSKLLLKSIIDEYISTSVDKRIRLLMAANAPKEVDVSSPSVIDISQYMSTKQQDVETIKTTDEEAEGFLTVLSIVKDFIPPERISWRDVSSYFGILIDDNNRKPLCRLHFNTSQKYISLFDGHDRQEEKIAISEISDIIKYRTRIVKTIISYLD